MGICLAREAANDLAYFARFEQGGQAGVTVTCVVVHDGQVFDGQFAEAVDQFHGNAGRAETTDKDRGTVLNTFQRLRDGSGNFIDQAGLRKG